MPKFLKILFAFAILSSLFTILSSQKVHALSFTYPEYNVDIKINKDSTFDVTETALYKFYGLTHGLTRDLTLEDLTRDCSNGRTCGGFDRVQVLSVKDNNGNDLTGKYTLEEVDTDQKRSLEFRWAIWPDGKELAGEEIGWTLKYRIFGGIQSVGNFPYFYWNVLPEDRTGDVDTSHISIHFPQNVNFNFNKLQLYDSSTEPTFDRSMNTLNIDESNLGAYSNYTVSYQFNKGEIDMPGNITYQITSPEISNDVYLDGIKVDENGSGEISSVPTGTHKLSFQHTGYVTQEKDVEIKSGETTNVAVSLTPTPIMQLLLVGNILLCLSACLLFPLAILFVVIHYRRKGRDKDMPGTIIPLYSPPKDVMPYLGGSLKDESVDKEDVAGTIIDLAYRGYIKIKELAKPGLFNPNGNYLLTKLDGKKGDPGLDDVEQRIMDGLFSRSFFSDGEDATVETKNLNTTFAYKYPLIVSKIYDLLVEKGYYERSPRTTVGIYIGLGIVLTVIGIMLGGFVSVFSSIFLGYISVFTPGFALAIMGIGFMIVAKAMPSRTSVGSKTYADIMGFRMYLYTAERYRLQNLTPEEFEKYLSYAIVFGIEKEWAEKFKGIYNKSPDWYEGSTNVYDALWVSSIARSFTNSTISNMRPISNSSARGGGWSGGSSFGGFSGGGGGGGSSGAW